MKVTYTNRHNEVQTFGVNERGNIQWKADFDFSSITSAKELKYITMVDPPGGPYINLGCNMGRIYKSFDGMIVKDFISNDDGYEIVILDTNQFDTVSEKEVFDVLEK
jgi:hypothetical protein